MKNNGILKIVGIVVACIAVLSIASVVVLSNIKMQEEDITPNTKNYEEHIYKLKNKYVGDNSSTSKIIQTVNKIDGAGYKHIQIEKIGDKNSVSAVYNVDGKITKLSPSMKMSFIENSFIIFSLIENLDNINFCISNQDDKIVKIDSIQRSFAISTLGYDPYEKTNTIDEFKRYITHLNSLDYKNMNTPVNTLEDAITIALKDYYKDKFYFGEYSSVGHITMDTQEDANTIKAYVYNEYSTYQFENKIFERSAYIICPVAITFIKDDYGNYTATKVEEPEDGARYAISLQKIFPENVIDKINAIKSDDTQKQVLKDQTIASVQEYLANIGREDSKIALSYQEKKYPSLDEKNSIIYDLLYKTYSEYPYYVGDIERLQNGNRYDYATSFEKVDGKDILTYTKKDMLDDKIVENVKLEIYNGSIKLLEGEIKKEYFEYEKKYKEDQKSAENYKN